MTLSFCFLKSGNTFSFGGTDYGMGMIFYCTLHPMLWFICHRRIFPFRQG